MFKAPASAHKHATQPTQPIAPAQPLKHQATRTIHVPVVKDNRDMTPPATAAAAVRAYNRLRRIAMLSARISRERQELVARIG